MGDVDMTGAGGGESTEGGLSSGAIPGGGSDIVGDTVEDPGILDPGSSGDE